MELPSSPPSASLSGTRRNSSLDGLNVHALAKTTRKILERLAPFCLLRPTGSIQDVAIMNKVVDKIKAFVAAIDSSMLATQMALSLSNEALRLSEAKSPEQEWNLVPRRADDGLGKLATLAGIGDKYAQDTSSVFTDVRQDLYKIAAITKEKRNVMVIVPFDPEQVDHNVTKSLRDVGMDLNASLNLLVDFSQQVSALAKWWSFVRGELEASAAAAALTTDPDVQPTSPTSPGAMTLPPALDVEMWARTQADYHSYFRTIRQVQARYPNLLAASNEAWQVSAQTITLSQSLSSSGHSSSPDHSLVVIPATKPEPDQHQSPTTPTSPNTFYDASSRPLSNAFDNINEPGKSSKDADQPKKKKGFILSPARASTLLRPTTGLTTDPKLSIKKMREFLFTRTVPRPEVRGLFPKTPKSANMSLSRSKSGSGASEQDKGKGKERENEESASGNTTVAVNEEKVAGPLASRSFADPPPQVPLIFLQDKEVESEKEPATSSKELDDDSPPPSIPSLSLAPSRASARSHPVTELGTERPAGSGSFQPAMEAAQAGPLVDEQTATRSWGGFAVFRAAEALARTGANRLLCGSCFGYAD